MTDQSPMIEKKHKTIRSKEWRAVLSIAIIVMIATTIPYLIGYETQGDAHRFAGFVFGVEDGNSYIAKMLSGWAGSWTFQSPYTAFPQNGLFLFIPYIVLGKLTAPAALHDQLVAIFHLFRIGAGIALFAASYQLIRRYITSRYLRIFTLLLINLGGGLGWIVLFGGQADWLGNLPLDFYSPETFGFISLFGLPHLVMARALMIWALLAYLDLFEQGTELSRYQSESKSVWRSAVKLSIFWALAGLFNPLALAILSVVILAHVIGTLIYNQKAARPQTYPWNDIWAPLGAASIIPLFYLTYFIFISINDPFAKQWMIQNQILSPKFQHYILAYGLMIPFAVVGAIHILRKEFSKGWLLAGWVLVTPIMVYTPSGLQRRLTEGVWIAICILSAIALDRNSGDGSGQKKNPINWWIIPLGLTFPSAIIFLLGGLRTALDPYPPIFLPRDQTEIFEFLQAEAQSQDVVLAAYNTGNALPAWAPVDVLAGHGPESIYLTEIYPEIRAFFQPTTSDAERLELIKRFEIQYVFWGPEERNLGTWNPGSASYLELVDSEGRYQLFRVRGFDP